MKPMILLNLIESLPRYMVKWQVPSTLAWTVLWLQEYARFLTLGTFTWTTEGHCMCLIFLNRRWIFEVP